MKKRTRRSFSSSYKTEVVDLVQASGKSIGAVGALTSAERDELTQLRRRVKTLEMERDVLKKATAFFVRESK